MNIQLVTGELTSYETELAEKLRDEKYATESWNFKGSFFMKNEEKLVKK